MTRETALHILTEHLANKALLIHSFGVEAAMRNLAFLFRGDTEEWGIAGLLHDADYEKAKGNPEKHGVLLFQLEPNTIPNTIEHAIKAHNTDETHVVPESPMDWALYCSDNLAAFISGCIHATKNKMLNEVTVEMVLQKMLDKKFLKNAKRGPIYLAEEKLGLPLEKFVSIVLDAMKKTASASRNNTLTTK